ncbi:tRNA lysidine(34) synthetase TilS [bacterium]|nr:tRNA lysidine(34) synthetase TilS [bacterium]MBQ9246878.1 tRNA lysidine(34) synthetase TilS [bacterium]
MTYLVGFSGGYDSMCLLDILRKTAPKNKIVALHLNHKWRGKESDNEAINCENFCKSLGIEFYKENLSFDVPHNETAARNARYEFFEKCSKKFDSKIVFTAHNANDNAETLIYRIAKGTGISGLQGISEKRDIFYRPLLAISRTEIEEYCRKNKLNPNFDSSNSDTKYKRNLIRAKVMPLLNEVSCNSLEAINSLSEIAKEDNEIVEEYISMLCDKISENDGFLTKKFLNLSNAVQNRIIYNLFIKYDLDYDRKKISYILDFIKENSNSKSGKTCSLTDNLWIFASEKIIKVITDEKIELPYFHILKEGKYESKGYIFEVEKFSKEVKKFPKENENIAYVDLRSFEMNFEVRTRQNGDVIQPYGMNGSQKLKKYLNSKKIPNHEKDKLLFLTYENEILWAINLGISDKIKVVKNPTHRLKFLKKG